MALLKRQEMALFDKSVCLEKKVMKVVPQLLKARQFLYYFVIFVPQNICNTGKANLLPGLLHNVMCYP